MKPIIKMMTTNPDSLQKRVPLLKTSPIDTPLGSMIAIASDDALYLLDFIDQSKLTRKSDRLQQQLDRTIIQGSNAILISIEKELKAWFSGELQVFNTPLALIGTAFQRQAWDALCRIPYGETRSYRQQAESIDKPSAYRAVANANGANRFPIVIPCHRIINTNGSPGGYTSGVSRKQWLIQHEKSNLRDIT